MSMRRPSVPSSHTLFLLYILHVRSVRFWIKCSALFVGFMLTLVRKCRTYYTICRATKLNVYRRRYRALQRLVHSASFFYLNRWTDRENPGNVFFLSSSSFLFSFGHSHVTEFCWNSMTLFSIVFFLQFSWLLLLLSMRVSWLHRSLL